MKLNKTTIQQISNQNIRDKVRLMDFESIKTELWNLGYRGVDELNEDEAFDKLVEYYEQNPDLI